MATNFQRKWPLQNLKASCAHTCTWACVCSSQRKVEKNHRPPAVPAKWNGHHGHQSGLHLAARPRETDNNNQKSPKGEDKRKARPTRKTQNKIIIVKIKSRKIVTVFLENASLRWRCLINFVAVWKRKMEKNWEEALNPSNYWSTPLLATQTPPVFGCADPSAFPITPMDSHDNNNNRLALFLSPPATQPLVQFF